MKILLVLFALLDGINGWAQGSVNFFNNPSSLVSVNLGGGQPVLIDTQPGSYYFGLLLASPGTTDPALFSFTGVYATNQSVAGRILGGITVVVPGWPTGTVHSYEVAGWSASLGATWQPGWLNGDFTRSGYFGISEIGSAASDPPGGNLDGLPDVNLFGGANGIQNGFVLEPVPEPSIGALAGLASGLLLLSHLGARSVLSRS